MYIFSVNSSEVSYSLKFVLNDYKGIMNEVQVLWLQIAGASFFGILLSKYDLVTCLKLAAGLILWSLPVVVRAIILYFFQSCLLFRFHICCAY